MNCSELQTYLENGPLADRGAWVADAETAEHLAQCADCSRLVEVRERLATGLRLIRESVPQPSGALDAAVLDAYRRQTTRQSRPQRVSLGSSTVLRWTAAVAAVALIVGLVFFSGRKGRNTAVLAPMSQPPRIARPLEFTKSVPTEIPRSRRRRTATVPQQHSRPAAASASQGTSFPDGFSSLMYCDSLSCAGTMDVIRVQMPSSAFTLPPPPSAQNNGMVYADVLVGPDGIARGIRIVQ